MFVNYEVTSFISVDDANRRKQYKCLLIMRVEDLTKFEGECPNIVVLGTYMDIRVPLTKKMEENY